MIYRYLLAALLCLAPAGALAQVRVEISFDQETYLPHEPMFATVMIYNSSGQTLVLGQDNEWLSINVEPVRGGVVPEKRPLDVKGEFSLPNGSRARRMVKLSDAFDLTKFGRYSVDATVHIPQWGERVSTRKPAHVGIATGVTLWENEFGLPSETAGERPEVRKYQLVQANHLKQLSLYVRIVDESGAETFTLFPLGRLVGLTRPEPQMDRWSNLHVFYQDAARSFRYFMITPDGLLLARQTWEIADGSRPALTVNAEGRISVTGGVRRVSSTDLPPPEPLSERSNASATVSPRQSPERVDAENAPN